MLILAVHVFLKKKTHMPKKTEDSMAPSSNRNEGGKVLKNKTISELLSGFKRSMSLAEARRIYVKRQIGELHCIPTPPPTCHHSVQTLFPPRCRLRSHHYQVKLNSLLLSSEIFPPNEDITIHWQIPRRCVTKI